jgi:tetratricopeptide (TPR) repeat protein
VRQSMLQSALIHKRQGRVDQAIAGFKAIVAQYPTMDGSRDALAGLESIYVEKGQVSEYEAYVRSLQFVDPSTLDLDEKYFRSAEKLYFDEKCPQAIGAFGDYLNKYPNGAYSLNALFYRGRLQLPREAKDEAALPDLEAVIARERHNFMESALYGASDILFRDQRWEGALEYYRKLEPVASRPSRTCSPPRWGRCAA